ncbi:MAG: ADP-ribosylglycohydrolase family protein [Candidatus Methanomethylophilaceae archaeon]|nr:ADP-ribosylglycohydrolase family protein [Candidatus Methanomethylophilaceae archaeon]
MDSLWAMMNVVLDSAILFMASTMAFSVFMSTELVASSNIMMGESRSDALAIATCCLIIAGYYGKGDFTETLHIITMCGLDADCNAGVLMPVLGISKGIGSIPERYMRPVFGTLTTYMRGDYSEIPLDRLVDMTVAAAAGARKR